MLPMKETGNRLNSQDTRFAGLSDCRLEPHVPNGTRAFAPQSNEFERQNSLSSTYYLTRGVSTLAGWTPQSARHVLGSAISAVIYLGWLSKRRVTQLNMAQVTGRPVDDPYVRHLALASWRNYGRYAADFLNFPHLDMNAIEQ